MHIIGLANVTLHLEGEFPGNEPPIRDHYSNDSFGIMNIIFPENWAGKVDPSPNGLFKISVLPDFNKLHGSEFGNKILNQSWVPVLMLMVIDKSIYNFPLEGVPANLRDPYSEVQSSKDLESLKQMALALGKSQEELEKMFKLSCKDLEAVSKIDINSKTFEGSSKICSTKWGPFVHKTYLYENSDKIYTVSLYGLKLLLFSKPGGEMPDLQQYKSVLDDTIKTLKIEDN